MQKPIRTAVVGFGLAGRVFHCPFVSAVPGLELAAIVQRHGEDAQKEYPNARICRSLEDALADPFIDLVVVGTPNATHVPFAAAALRAGKHVVVDKPVAATSTEVRSLIDLARSTGKLLAPFHNRRFDGDFLTLRKVLAEGTLGHIVEISSRFDRYSPVVKPGSWRETTGPSHGVFFDLGPHLVDQAMALLGDPATVAASIRSERIDSETDDSFDLALDFHTDGGMLRFLCGATVLATHPGPRYKVRGSLGGFFKHGVDPQEPAILAGARPPVMGSPEDWLTEPEAAWASLTVCPDPQEPGVQVQTSIVTEPGDYRLFYANVRDAILGEKPLAISGEDAWRTIRLLEIALQSSHEGKRLPVQFDLS